MPFHVVSSSRGPQLTVCELSPTVRPGVTCTPRTLPGGTSAAKHVFSSLPLVLGVGTVHDVVYRPRRTENETPRGFFLRPVSCPGWVELVIVMHQGAPSLLGSPRVGVNGETVQLYISAPEARPVFLARGYYYPNILFDQAALSTCITRRGFLNLIFPPSFTSYFLPSCALLLIPGCGHLHGPPPSGAPS